MSAKNENPHDTPQCPACSSEYVYFSKKKGMYICEECRHEFTVEQPVNPMRIFLSYGHDDNEELVMRIKHDLESRGHEVWFDKSKIKAGEDWRRTITEGIMDSARVVSFLSKHSTRTPGVCLDEISIALGAKGGNIQTILVEGEQQVRPPATISHIQWLDMHDWKKHRGEGKMQWDQWYRRKFDEIVKVIESEESRRFAGEIETLNNCLKPIASESRISQLLRKGFVGRKWLTEAVEEWRTDESRESRLFWIVGAPGVGKSAFAAQLAHFGGDRIVAARFCEWDKPDHRNANRVVRSLAFQLATRFPDYRKLLLTLPEIDALEEKQPAELFDYLLAEPLRSAIDGGRQRYLICIDALDEAMEGARNPLVELLARDAVRLPSWLGLVITSRPESSVTAPLQGLNPHILDAQTERNRDDIRCYLRAQLAEHLKNRNDAEAVVERIVRRSEGVFLYVERVCDDIIHAHLSLDRLDDFPHGLGGIFWQFFVRQFPDREQYKKDIRPALRVILAARQPLPLQILQDLFGWSDEELRDITRALGSLFPVSKTVEEETIRACHKSIIDWLGDESKAGEYYVSIAAGNPILAQFGYAEYEKDLAALHPYFIRYLAAHSTSAGMWDALETLLTDLLFIQAKCMAGFTSEMLSDFTSALALMPQDKKQLIQPFMFVFKREMHHIRRRPDLAFQQMYNELQWREGRVREIAEKARTSFLKRGGTFLRQYRAPAIAKSNLTMTITGHRDVICSCAWSPDDSNIASASKDGTVRIWDARSGEETRRLTGHGEQVTACAWSPDCQQIISSSWDKTIKVWDARTGRDIRTLTGHSRPVRMCTFSPDGRRIASASEDKTIKIWDTARGKELLTLAAHSLWVECCAWSPDGRYIASGSGDKTIKIWDATTGKEIVTLSGHGSTVRSCAWSPDNNHLVSASLDRTLKIWGVKTGNEIRTLIGHKGWVESCSWSPDGRCIVSGGDDATLRIWDATSGDSSTTLSGHSSDVRSCSWSFGGSRIVSASDDKSIKIWNAFEAAEDLTLEAPRGGIDSCAWSPDGRKLATTSKDSTARLWEAKTWKEIETLAGHGNFIRYCSWSPDNLYIVTASEDETLRIWETETGKEVARLTGHSDFVRSCSWSPDARRIVSGGRDERLKVWDVKALKETRTLAGHRRSVDSCAWSPDGKRVVSASRDGYLKLWDPKTGRELSTLQGHKGWVRFCAWSPDGKQIASAGSDATLRIWNVQTAEEIQVLNGHHRSVESCCWTPDARRIVSASMDEMVKIWDPTTGVEIVSFLCSGYALSCAISGSGQTICCGDEGGSLYSLQPEGALFTEAPVYTTPVHLSSLGNNNQTRSVADSSSALCPHCGRPFPLPLSLLNVISSILRICNVTPDESPCMKLPPEAWDEPKLLSKCPNCDRDLRVNPFVVDAES